MKPLFLTGATGFVGRRVVAALASQGVRDVSLLVRHDPARRLPPMPPGWTVVEGDLLEPAGWAGALRESATVLHLAALTGKAPRAAHWRQNVEASRRLLAAAKEGGAGRVIFVSSIAAGFQDRRWYHYAEAKAQTETDVRESGLEWLVVRPTTVLGPGSPVLAGLRRLATLPRPVLFGPGQRMQPVHVEDVAEALVAAAALPGLGGDTVEIGGPDEIEMTELLGRLRAASALPSRRPLRIPLGPARAVLAALEPVALRLLPFSAGQLATFANPTVAKPHPLHAVLPRPQRHLDEMLGPPDARPADSSRADHRSAGPDGPISG